MKEFSAKTVEEAVNDVVPETAAPTEPETVAETTQAAPQVEETIVETPSVSEENMTIELKPGESVYNANTGVEVGYNGNAAYVDNNNTVPLEEVPVEYNEANNAVVEESDWVTDNTTDVNVPVIGDVNRSGLEVDEETFKEGKTDAELNNIDIAEDAAFEQFLQDNGLLEDNGKSR